jgi:hypothetical protein
MAALQVWGRRHRGLLPMVSTGTRRRGEGGPEGSRIARYATLRPSSGQHGSEGGTSTAKDTGHGPTSRANLAGLENRRCTSGRTFPTSIKPRRSGGEV